MKYMHCGGELERGFAPFHVDRAGVHVQLDRVPAWLCGQCGEPMFEAASVDSVQSILLAADEAFAKMQKSA